MKVYPKMIVHSFMWFCEFYIRYSLASNQSSIIFLHKEHIKDVVENSSGPTSRWCKDIAKWLKCNLVIEEPKMPRDVFHFVLRKKPPKHTVERWFGKVRERI